MFIFKRKSKIKDKKKFDNQETIQIEIYIQKMEIKLVLENFFIRRINFKNKLKL